MIFRSDRKLRNPNVRGLSRAEDKRNAFGSRGEKEEAWTAIEHMDHSWTWIYWVVHGFTYRRKDNLKNLIEREKRIRAKSAGPGGRVTRFKDLVTRFVDLFTGFMDFVTRSMDLVTRSRKICWRIYGKNHEVWSLYYQVGGNNRGRMPTMDKQIYV